MHLTRTQERLLTEGNPAERKAMRILVTLGEMAHAEDLVPISSAHVSGASYQMIGDAGLRFLDDFARYARVRVPTSVNPLGTDLTQWRELGIPEDFARKQRRIARAYGKMGVRPTYSCTPYLLGMRPRRGDHLAWAESNAVCFANSVCGARTNREGGPSALAAAVVGATPNCGLHLAAARRPTVEIDVRAKVRGFGFSLLGLLVGSETGDGVPYLRGVRPTEDDLKWLGAAAASSGGVGLIHVAGVTPEAARVKTRGLRKVRVTSQDLRAVQREYTTGSRAELLGLGSPQLSADELAEVAQLVERTPPRIPVWVFTNRAAREARPEAVAAIERNGGRVLADTCLEVTLLEHRFGTVATPYGKGAYYLPGLCHQKVILDDLRVLLERYA
jgi:predicted aconitase